MSYSFTFKQANGEQLRELVSLYDAAGDQQLTRTDRIGLRFARNPEAPVWLCLDDDAGFG